MSIFYPPIFPFIFSFMIVLYFRVSAFEKIFNFSKDPIQPIINEKQLTTNKPLNNIIDFPIINFNKFHIKNSSTVIQVNDLKKTFKAIKLIKNNEEKDALNLISNSFHEKFENKSTKIYLVDINNYINESIKNSSFLKTVELSKDFIYTMDYDSLFCYFLSNKTIKNLINAIDFVNNIPNGFFVKNFIKDLDQLECLLNKNISRIVYYYYGNLEYFTDANYNLLGWKFKTLNRALTNADSEICGFILCKFNIQGATFADQFSDLDFCGTDNCGIPTFADHLIFFKFFNSFFENL